MFSDLLIAGSRREMLKSSACGFGSLALAGLAGRNATAEQNATHAPPRAKRVIFLFMHGGPSHVDMFDYKPELQKRSGEDLPFEPEANLDAKSRKLYASPWKFTRHGDSGHYASELVPHLAQEIDELCFIHSMHTKGTSHGQAVSMLHTGTDSLVRPSLGAWVHYGLGSENENLPGFVSIMAPVDHGGPRNYGSAFLPAIYQGTAVGYAGMQAKKADIAFLQGSSAGNSKMRQALLERFNQSHLAATGPDAELEGAIKAFELAFRMQRFAPEVLDLSGEPAHVQKMYGLGEKETDNFGRQCLLARRMAEAGVRFIQVATPNVWDQHGSLQKALPKNCRMVDQPIAALLRDLRQRGLLDDTLVVWSGEFGRTPISQGSDGRDHNPQGFTTWLAGAGVKGGYAYGSTDEFGYHAAESRTHMHDLHATLLHLLGLDHERLTYRYGGRDFRLTDVYGSVVRDILA